jgi:hypothetical protein
MYKPVFIHRGERLLNKWVGIPDQRRAEDGAHYTSKPKTGNREPRTEKQGKGTMGVSASQASSYHN